MDWLWLQREAHPRSNHRRKDPISAIAVSRHARQPTYVKVVTSKVDGDVLIRPQYHTQPVSVGAQTAHRAIKHTSEAPISANAATASLQVDREATLAEA